MNFITDRQASNRNELPSRPGHAFMQRKCACQNHTIGGIECEECKKQKQTLQRDSLSPYGMKYSNEGATLPTAQKIPVSTGSSSESPNRIPVEPTCNNDFSRVPASTSIQQAKANGGPTNSFEDCPTTWQKKANTALTRGRPWVANVITGLANLPNPIPTPVATLLSRHFHTNQRGHIREIVGHFNTIYSAMNAPIDFECETSCDDNVAAYVYSVWTDLHLCPIWYGLSSDSQANTIIHEIAHDAANRDDEAYVWQPKYSKLSPEDAIDNADSYSNFAEEASRP